MMEEPMGNAFWIAALELVEAATAVTAKHSAIRSSELRALDERRLALQRLLAPPDGNLHEIGR